MNKRDVHDILQTVAMIKDQNLDIRTVTMGISLTDCARGESEATCEAVFEKITRCAGRLVEVCATISAEYGIPIINKRISVTPAATLCGPTDPLRLAQTLDAAAQATGVDFLGGFSALVQKGFSKGDRALIEAIPQALADTKKLCSSVNVASTRAGINMDAVRLMGEVVRQTAQKTARDNCMGCAKLVVFANAVEDNPFMAGAFHGFGEPDCVINVGVSGPGVVAAALREAGDCDLAQVSEIIKKTAFKITRMGQLVAALAAQRLGVEFGIVDLSLAPTPAVGDSVAEILELIGLESCGCCGTTAALALLNDAVKKGGIMASSQVGGLSGAFIPVSEDAGMIAAVRRGALRIEKLEAMTAVCSVGLDMIAIPGDTPASVISAIIADEVSIGVVNSKTTAVRVIPAIGKKVGDELDFGGLFGSAPVMEVSAFSPEKMIMRGGRIPAVLQALKN